MNLTIDINADVGERPNALLDGTEEAIIKLISSANIACGGHAGDQTTMERVIQLCAKFGVVIGAHPGYPDRANFGRHEMSMSSEEIQATVFEQVSKLGKKAKTFNVELQHVKPHGALYNAATRDKSVAEAIGHGVAKWSRDLILVGLAGSTMLKVWENWGFRVAAEAFADRVYESDGALRSRTKQDAMMTDPAQACQQAISIIKDQKVISGDGIEVPLHARTICVHSDTPNAAEILSRLRRRLKDEGIVVERFV